MTTFRDVQNSFSELELFRAKHPRRNSTVKWVDDLSPGGEATRLLHETVDLIFADLHLVGENASVDKIPPRSILGERAAEKFEEFKTFLSQHKKILPPKP